MKSFIKIIATFAFLFFVGSLSAQNHWTLNGTDIYKNNSGNVGVGITSPTEDLHVYNAEGSASFMLQSNYNELPKRAIGNIMIENTASSDMLNISLRRKNGVHEMVQSAYSSSVGGGTWLAYCYLNLSTRKYEMRGGILDAEFNNGGDLLFNNTGGVGINTSSIPTGYALAVDGKVIAEELEVQLSTSWPDFVFEKDYKLRSLYDVEQFINDNGHLPDVPSAEELENGNINVAEMDAKLLQKIEELTLYVIDLKKENEELKKHVNNLLEK